LPPLKSGGSIVIDGTEALTAIDVNSGGSMRGTNQEETAHKTNLEAAREVARQLRLRDLGGIIVVDFIDMRVQSHITDVERALREAMRPEKARHDVGRISRLGLLEISRQRLRPAAVASSYTACPMCEGHGSIRTAESAALGTLRKIHHRVAEGDIAQMNVTLPRDWQPGQKLPGIIWFYPSEFSTQDEYDRTKRAQNLNSLLGKILRIDVSGATYSIPLRRPIGAENSMYIRN